MIDESRRANLAFWLRQFKGLTEENISNLMNVLETGEDIAIADECKAIVIGPEVVEKQAA